MGGSPSLEAFELERGDIKGPTDSGFGVDGSEGGGGLG